MRLLQIIRVVLSLGMPPAITDQSALRMWCQKLADVASELADLTQIDLDDKLAAGLATIVDNDAYWSALYAIIVAAIEYSQEDGELIVGDEADSLSAEAGIDPATIVLIIEAVMQLIKWWRERK
jgi:signal transduction histidine kinase